MHKVVVLAALSALSGSVFAAALDINEVNQRVEQNSMVSRANYDQISEQNVQLKGVAATVQQHQKILEGQVIINDAHDHLLQDHANQLGSQATDISKLQTDLRTLQRTPGPQGPKGDTGAKGDKGDQGIQGVAGTNGSDGKDGINGIDGKDGRSGKDVDQSRIDSFERKQAQLESEIKNVQQEANAGTSSAMAMASVPSVLEHQHFSIGAGIGAYNGESAIAVGASARVTDNTVVKLNVSADSNQDFGVGAGVAYGW